MDVVAASDDVAILRKKSACGWQDHMSHRQWNQGGQWHRFFGMKKNYTSIKFQVDWNLYICIWSLHNQEPSEMTIDQIKCAVKAPGKKHQTILTIITIIACPHLYMHFSNYSSVPPQPSNMFHPLSHTHAVSQA